MELQWRQRALAGLAALQSDASDISNRERMATTLVNRSSASQRPRPSTPPQSESCSLLPRTEALFAASAQPRPRPRPVHKRLSTLMFAWVRLNSGDASEVRAWTDRALDADAFMLALTENLPTDAWTHGMGFDGMGDRVARRITRVELAPYESVLDVPRFLGRVAQMIEHHSTSAEDRSQLEGFLRVPRGNLFRDD